MPKNTQKKKFLPFQRSREMYPYRLISIRRSAPPRVVGFPVLDNGGGDTEEIGSQTGP